MYKFTVKGLATFLLLMSIFYNPNQADAGSGIVSIGKSTNVNITFRIIIPTSLTLRVNTLATDTITTASSLKNVRTPSTEGQVHKGIWIEASGQVTRKGTMHLSSSASHLDNDGQDNENIQFLWTAGQITVYHQTDQNKKTDQYSLITSLSGNYSFEHLEPHTISPQEKHKHHYYTLCSP